MYTGIITKKVSTGISGLDKLLGGGLESRMITQFVGEAGSGKSTICLAIAIEILRNGGDVIYIDSEGFSIERFVQIAGNNSKDLLKRIYINEPTTFDGQLQVILDSERYLQSGNIQLIVVDSATALYRLEQMDKKESMSKLSRHMMVLLGFAKRYNIPIVITNQVFMDIDHNKLVGLGGTILAHISKVIVNVEKKGLSRRLTITKHRSQPEEEIMDFNIIETGICEINNS